ncbi:hypothetical protein SADUNF_Sadunf16G0118100 [Salix dunnii]|uniref:Uncharacterized protein n=1 Tax=Salix dunnii TaxID=1413687 RepID=A0A835JDS9_9ROSI|nr:hypothetical protein SADUNF_Sadunf16G0118100 [Salix dunnii]
MKAREDLAIENEARIENSATRSSIYELSTRFFLSDGNEAKRELTADGRQIVARARQPFIRDLRSSIGLTPLFNSISPKSKKLALLKNEFLGEGICPIEYSSELLLADEIASKHFLHDLEMVINLGS